MMVRRITVPLLSAVLIAVVFARPADACSCVGPGPACQATWDAAAVFVAQVVEVVEAVAAQPQAQIPPTFDALFVKRRVRLRIVETLRGPATSIVDVYTGQGDSDCGYRFVAGRTYLVYASESSGRYYTGICQRTRPLDEAAED